MNFELSHAVDDSDVAFVMRLDRKSTVCSMMSSRSTHYHKVGTNIDAFINLPTLNYLLAGLQLCYSSSHNQPSKWFELLHDLDQYQYPTYGAQLTLWDLRFITRELIVPFGVARGSEKQGGQDETGLSPATWPVNFVTSLVLDGHESNVVNYWHHHDVSAGDDLVFRLKPMPIPRGRNAYTLNHYYKGYVQHNFESYFLMNLGDSEASHVWQLVPDVFSLDYRPENDLHHGEQEVKMSRGFEVPKNYVWQEHGFWHVGRSQVMFRKYALKEYYNDDMANQLKVNHMDLTFEPAYVKVPGECRDNMLPECVKVDNRSRDARPPVQADYTQRRNANAVAPGMMAPAGVPDPWAPSLMLEGARMAELIHAPMPRLRMGDGQPAQKHTRHELEAALEPRPCSQAVDLAILAPHPSSQAVDLATLHAFCPAVSLRLMTAAGMEAAAAGAFSAGPEKAAADPLAGLLRTPADELASEGPASAGQSIASAMHSVLTGRTKKAAKQAKDPAQ